MATEKTKQKGRYLIFGILNTVINYGMYETLALLIFTAENQLWLATMISGVESIFVGYYLHSQFTWKDRKVGKKELGKFFIWNVIMSIAVRPALTWFFGFFGFLYQFAFNICEAIHIPFSYEFIATTGNYVLMTAVVMVINFLVYDKFVFGETKEKKVSEKSTSEDEKE
ncbi:GtrA family protein [Candidatus Saccharibacteria bacterium]|nr:GtrA family protein [Candidatus Saccharibacteria bacterium]